MKRLTRHIDQYPCRIINCLAEGWIENLINTRIYNWDTKIDICNKCPFEKYINRLAELEDEAERMEDDRK